MPEDTVVSEFHKKYYNSAVWNQDTKWMGIPVQKCPLDAWVYQEILFEIKPDLIIETGTCYSGGALFLANMCDILGTGHVVTTDIVERSPSAKHERITYLLGSSISPDIVYTLEGLAKNAKTVMLILDSDHSMDHVRTELELYSPLVTLNSYVIVEDTNVNGHPIMPGSGPGPMEAVHEFLKVHPEFIIDKSREKFMMTQNPDGYLKRVK